MLRGDQSRHWNLNWGRINAELQKMGPDHLLPSVSGSFGKEAFPYNQALLPELLSYLQAKIFPLYPGQRCLQEVVGACPIPTSAPLSSQSFSPAFATLWAPGQPLPAFQCQEQFPNLSCFPCRVPLPLSGFRKFPWVFWEAHLQKTPETQRRWFGDKWLLKIVHLFTELKHSTPSCWCSSWKYWC